MISLSKYFEDYLKALEGLERSVTRGNLGEFGTGEELVTSQRRTLESCRESFILF